ncbi:hypothetical protein LZ32DRAFT_316627 [Colletotrichum eremochloae]|nr:hypothetical protein LZ32DRAFT_316627 [Colletotrichum eremochloae]
MHTHALSLSLSFSVFRLFLHPVPAPALAGSRSCFIRVPDRSKQSPEFPGWVVLSVADTRSLSFSLSAPFALFPIASFLHLLAKTPIIPTPPMHINSANRSRSSLPTQYGKTDRR